MNDFLKVLVDILSQPAILVALIALIGLIAQRKKIIGHVKRDDKNVCWFPRDFGGGWDFIGIARAIWRNV